LLWFHSDTHFACHLLILSTATTSVNGTEVLGLPRPYAKRDFQRLG